MHGHFIKPTRKPPDPVRKNRPIVCLQSQDPTSSLRFRGLRHVGQKNWEKKKYSSLNLGIMTSIWALIHQTGAKFTLRTTWFLVKSMCEVHRFSMAKPEAPLTSGFSTPTTLYVTLGLGEGGRQSTYGGGVLCSVPLCRDCITEAWEQTQAALIPRKLQWSKYKVLQGDPSSAKTHDWRRYCCALLGL